MDTTSPSTIPGSKQPRARSVWLRFDGERGPLLWLCIKNLVLTILTLGIYRFWAKTRLRRFFWGHTSLDGEPFEYTGRGRDLLIGSLIVIFAFAAVTGAYFLSIFFIRRHVTSEYLALFYAVPLIIVFIFLFHVAVYRAWRYRLRRTSWRGIRFDLDGQSWRYALRSFRRLFLLVLTFGLATPYFNVSQASDIIEHARFGKSRIYCRPRTSGSALMGYWITHLLATILILIVIPVLLIFVFGGSMASFSAPGYPAGELKVSGPISLGIFFMAIVYTLIFASYFRYWTHEKRYLASNIVIGQTTFESRLNASDVLKVWLGFALALAILLGFPVLTVQATIGLESLFETVMVSVPQPDAPQTEQTARLSALGFAVLAVVFLGGTLLFRVIVFHGIFRHFIETLICANPDALAAVTQAEQQTPWQGEGLAEAFDVGGI